VFCTRIFLVVGEDDSVPLWYEGKLKPDWYLLTKPKEQGIWVWESVPEGWRHPTNKEWGAIFRNKSPLNVEPEDCKDFEWFHVETQKPRFSRSLELVVDDEIRNHNLLI
jgi:hypothetical protein